MQAVNSEVEAFRSKLDANGQPAFPHFETVNGLMAAILSAGNATTLEEAYQLAVKAHPETSKAIEQQAQAAAQAAEDKRRKAEAARRKSGSLRTGAGSPTVANGKDRSIRDELKAAWDDARGRI
jgi:DNA gyrase/topoisomerase IV subunit B